MNQRGVEKLKSRKCKGVKLNFSIGYSVAAHGWKSVMKKNTYVHEKIQFYKKKGQRDATFLITLTILKDS